MKLGFGLPVSGAWATPETMRHVATRAEDLGYDSLWTFQRLLHPVDEEWGQPYHAVLDPVTALAYVAATTSRIRLGLAVVNSPFYSPLVLSKALTTLDIVSGGRLDVGLGLAWSPLEFTAVGAPMARRGARSEEFVQALDAIWTQAEVQFHGEFFELPQCQVLPKSVQQPRPPILLGGTVEAALRRAGRISDGWISSSRTDLATIGRSIDIVRAAADEAERDPEALRFVVRGVVHLTPEPLADRTPLRGSATQIRADLADLAEVGVTEVFLDLNYDPRTVSDGVGGPEGLANAELALTQLAPPGN